MKRTRKWAYVAQEARRLTELGLSSSAIGKRLGVNGSTVRRWRLAGKLGKARRSGQDAPVMKSASGEAPATVWAAAVRKAYALDVTDEQLVDLAQVALMVAQDAQEPASVRLTAMGRFQSLVKQLALIARQADEEPARKPDAVPVVPPPPRTDPRSQWMELQ